MTSSTKSGRYQEDRDSGWLIFAVALLLTLGIFNVIDGIAAIGKSHFYVANAHYIFGDLKTWGWIVLCLGALQLLSGVGLYSRNQIARWGGVAILSLDALAQLLMMPSYPFWALVIIAIDVVALYGIIAYGGRTG
jgi:hypothetical protein